MAKTIATIITACHRNAVDCIIAAVIARRHGAIKVAESYEHEASLWTGKAHAVASRLRA
jgi:hypothetical protein